METLHKFKLLAMQCATARSPSRIPPAAAPCFPFRRRLTLRKLLGRSSDRRSVVRGDPAADQSADLGEKEGLLSHKLKDLFVSSPPPSDGGDGVGSDCGSAGKRFEFEEFCAARRRRGGGTRFGAFAIKCRQLRRAWRPRLGAIPE